MMRKYYFVFLFLLFSKIVNTQITSLLEVGIGSQGDEIISGFGIATGYTLNDNRSFGFGGFKIQRYTIIPRHETRNNEHQYINETTDLHNLALFIGSRYSVTLINLKEDQGRFVLYPEVRLYFSPCLPSE